MKTVSSCFVCTIEDVSFCGKNPSRWPNSKVKMRYLGHPSIRGWCHFSTAMQSICTPCHGIADKKLSVASLISLFKSHHSKIVIIFVKLKPILKQGKVSLYFPIRDLCVFNGILTAFFHHLSKGHMAFITIMLLMVW